jgi:PleD family two-component response regulator
MMRIRGDNLGMDAIKVAQFRDLALLELKRAERYRNFLSLLVLNLSEFLGTVGRRKITSEDQENCLLDKAINRLRLESRETDLISRLDDDRLAMLLPETDFNGARIAADRFQGLLTDLLADFLQSNYRFDVPLEITSFPDATGEVSFKSRLAGLASRN